jgi:hypothetical protein
LNKFLAPLFTILLVLGVGYLIFTSASQQLSGPVKVKGAIGSEKEAFFADPELQQVLKDKGFSVEVIKAGSRSLATTFDLTGFDFAFPAGSASALKLKKDRKVATTFDVFYSPMVIATWKTISSILIANGVAANKGKYDELNLVAFLELFKANKRWSDLKNSADYDVSKPVLINTTDVRSSNSAAQYLGLVSYILNNKNVVSSSAEASQIIATATALFAKQGFQESSSAGPFEDYFLIGMGKSPLVFIYESQFLEKVVEKALRPEMRLMYPSPTIFSKHVLVPLSDKGLKLGELMTSDLNIQRIAAKYGFRPSNPSSFAAAVQQYNLPIKDNIVNVVDPPSYEILEAMIVSIEKR